MTYWGDQVVIVPNVSSSSGYFPVVDETVEEIPYLLIEAGAYLVITDSGQLTINGETTYNYGLLNAGELINEGELFIFRTAMPALGPGHGRLTNQGVLAMDDPAQPVRYAQRN